MGKIFITGDKHGDYFFLAEKLEKLKTTKNDVVIILGDHGTLYYGANDDRHKKKLVSNMPATFIMIRGNHDRRANAEEYEHKLIYVDSPNYCGSFYVDENYPNILYTMEYGWYRFGSQNVFVVCGAYSVDKFKRLEMQQNGFSQYHWFADEQLSVHEQFDAINSYNDNASLYENHCIMSHTCPQKYKPWDTLLDGINQSLVDQSMEIWLDKIEQKSLYSNWYCGHWHIERRIDKMCFLYNDIKIFDYVKENENEGLSE